MLSLRIWPRPIRSEATTSCPRPSFPKQDATVAPGPRLRPPSPSPAPKAGMTLKKLQAAMKLGSGKLKVMCMDIWHNLGT